MRYEPHQPIMRHVAGEDIQEELDAFRWLSAEAVGKGEGSFFGYR